MKPLLTKYLHHIDHYLKDETILKYSSRIIDDEVYYIICTSNTCLEGGEETFSVSLDEILMFLFDMNKGNKFLSLIDK